MKESYKEQPAIGKRGQGANFDRNQGADSDEAGAAAAERSGRPDTLEKIVNFAKEGWFPSRLSSKGSVKAPG